jgi:glycosyltransferase involved in cell wall biosynthesis
MRCWHIITGEYPPQPGGVSDYTQLVARGLAGAGDAVVVWAPPAKSGPANGRGRLDAVDRDARDSGIDVRRLPDRFGARSLRILSGALNRTREPHRLLVQYVPHAFGWKAANVPFCLWLRSRRRDSVWVMFHEVSFPFGVREGLARNALAVVNRAMASLVGRAAERAFVSIPAWRAGVDRVTSTGTPVTWLPVPSGIPVVADDAATAGIRARHGDGRPLVGHFGTYGGLIRPLLDAALSRLVEISDCRMLLLGKGSIEARAEMIASHPGLAERVFATGRLPAAEISLHVSACDLMLQPYPDGVSSRRTSAMVALLHRVPLVTTRGSLTEPVWESRGAAVMVPESDVEALAAAAAALLADPAARVEVARRAAAMYDEQFDLRHTIAALRSPA